MMLLGGKTLPCRDSVSFIPLLLSHLSYPRDSGLKETYVEIYYICFCSLAMFSSLNGNLIYMTFY